MLASCPHQSCYIAIELSRIAANIMLSACQLLLLTLVAIIKLPIGNSPWLISQLHLYSHILLVVEGFAEH